MNNGLMMAMLSRSNGGEMRRYPMENRRIGFGENDDYTRPERHPRPMRNEYDDGEEMRHYPMESRRQPRDDRGRYTTRRRSEYTEGNIVPYPMSYAPGGEHDRRRNMAPCTRFSHSLPWGLAFSF